MKKIFLFLFICVLFLVSCQQSTEQDIQDTPMDSNIESEVAFFPDTEISLT